MTLGPASLKLSVIIAASNDSTALAKCLLSLKGQGETEDTEVIAVCNFNEGLDTRKHFPFVRYVTLPSDTTVPELRTTGINLSRGEVVALVEDYCILDEHWCAEIKKAHDAFPYGAIGGAVENRSPDKPLNWAVYFFDYGKYMLPLEAGMVASLSGTNVSYKRGLLEKMEVAFQQGFDESSVEEMLRKRGHKLFLQPPAVAYLNKEYKFAEILRTFYYLARCFAGRRVAHSSPIRRIFLTVGSIGLLILLPLRIMAGILLKKRNRKRLLSSVPYLFVLTVSWSAGEFAGYLFGEGASARKRT